MIINFISDTVTKPTPPMLAAMMNAEVGDDVFGEDPTIRNLEQLCAQMFGKEAAIFCPSGTMTNQIALKAHTEPLDEVVMDEMSHIYKSEVGGYAFNSAIGVTLLRGGGKLNRDMVAAAIKPDFDWLPRTRLVVLENTCNHAGGLFYRLEEIVPIRALCQERGLKLHLDGARLFNALVETGETTLDWGAQFDSISICLSKGLGAPVGSVLIGNQDFIKKSRKIRKAMGGGMRQAGFLAAAGIFALQNNIQRLKEDNLHAKLLGECLKQLNYVENVRPVESNILIFDVKQSYFSGEKFLEKLNTEGGIRAALFGTQTVRFVTHLEISKQMIDKAIQILKSFN